MDKETMRYTRDRLLFSFEKEGNPAIFDNVEEPGGHFAKL